MRQRRQRASADDQRHTGQRDQRADSLAAAEAFVQGQCGQEADHQRTGPIDERGVGGSGGAQAGVEEAAEAEHARHAHTEQERPFPAGPALAGRPAQQQCSEDDGRDGERAAVRVNGPMSSRNSRPRAKLVAQNRVHRLTRT